MTTVNKGFRFVDLFCGIGGFHQAMESLGGECVFACDIDGHCRDTYLKNYGLEPASDITKIDARDVPEHDVLCGGFPCQSFSKAGKRLGFDDPTKGTLFFDVIRIIQEKRPEYVLLENVRNLASHDGGNTWRVIYESLRDAGYELSETPTLFSPHWIGIPHHRERVFIMAVRTDIEDSLPQFCFNTEHIPECNIDSVLENESEVDNRYRLTEPYIQLLDYWNEFIHNTCVKETGALPGFPIWSLCFYRDGSEGNIEEMPKWKQNFVRKNIEYYEQNRKFINEWLYDDAGIELFFGSKAKLEWQCGLDAKHDIWDKIVQIRPSGVRVRPATYFPALVAMDQHSIICSRRRYMTPRECARIQSFPDSFILDESDAQAYKQFGNSVNVEVVKLFGQFLFGDEDVRRNFSHSNQFGSPEIIQDVLI